MNLLQGEEAPLDDLMELVQQIVYFHMKVWLVYKLPLLLDNLFVFTWVWLQVNLSFLSGEYI